MPAPDRSGGLEGLRLGAAPTGADVSKMAVMLPRVRRERLRGARPIWSVRGWGKV